MADIYFDVDAALAEVPVNKMPLIDDTDFKSIEGAVAYNAAGMALRWHFVTSAGAYTVTSVTPTTGGDYDWTDQGDSGVYTIEIPASGGASINNDTEGYGWFTGVATGILPWCSPVYGFRAAGINDLLCDSAYSTTRGLAGTALPNAAADAAGGLPISDAGGLDLDSIKTDTAAILVDTGTTLDARIPAALVGGRMDATVDATGMESGATGAIRDAILARTTASGVVGSGSTTANVVASSVAVGATTSLSADAWKGRVIIFNSDTTTAALRGQAAVIVSHTSGSTPTFTLASGAWTTAPLTTDSFTVV